MGSSSDSESPEAVDDAMSKNNFWEEEMVRQGINKAEKGDNMNKEEPDALKWSQIVSIEKVFSQLDHFALDNLLYDATK